MTNQSRTFVFNGDNKQVEVKNSGGVTIGRYHFDGEGRRIKKVTDFETIIYVYSNGKLIAEYSNAPPEEEPTTNFTVTDMLGSPRVLTNSVGEIVSRRDFAPFGEEIFADSQNRTTGHDYSHTGEDSVRKRFTGYEKDMETGLDFAENRMYENRHGRFTAVDPLLASGKSANPQTFNRYVYVLNNPLILTDPDGLQVGVAKGTVYQKGDSFAIFRGKPYEGYKPVTRTINTQTTIGGVQHHLTVTRNGWKVGNRIDGATFSAPAASPLQGPPVENAAIRALSTAVVNGVSDAATGIGKGIVNSPVVAWNGATSGIFNGGPQAAYFRGSNPFAAPNILEYSNAREASYGSAGSAGFLAGLGAGVGVFSGASAPLSVVPRISPVNNPIPSTLARVIPGNGPFPTLGLPNRGDVFVTAADDIAGMSASQIGPRLGIPRSDSFTVIEFPTPTSGLASPVFRPDPGFIGFGRTTGGAREFVIPNGVTPCNATVRIVC